MVHIPKTIFVTGGVLSSLGKGIAAASLGALLEARGYRIRLRKCEPYLNVDPGTMSPYQHGEVYITDDGAETDLDLGHYERFSSITTTRDDAVTTGQIYQETIARERRGDYLGATVQVIPHITDMIQHHFVRGLDPDTDFLIIEIGGTVGDIEGLPFIEAARQFAVAHGRENVMFLHVTLVPFMKASGEFKTKPTQHSVKAMQSMGVQPDLLYVRSETAVPEDARGKLSLFCNIPKTRIIAAPDVKSIYLAPQVAHDNHLDHQVCTYFGCPPSTPDLSKWSQIAHAHEGCRVFSAQGKIVRIGIVGKYVTHLDAYKSLDEALRHAELARDCAIEVVWINAADYDADAADISKALESVHAVIVPGGYGERGMRGKLKAITYARSHGVPYLGICLGMQLAVIEFARSVLELPAATSAEIAPDTPNPIIGLITAWQDRDGETQERDATDLLGGTMRLGRYECRLTPGTRVHKLYQKTCIHERHRHRYELNTNYTSALQEKGMYVSGWSPDGQLPEIIELVHHPWFIGVQFHPEFLSRPHAAHPLFTGVLDAAYSYASRATAPGKKANQLGVAA